MNILFWNTGRRNLGNVEDCLLELITERDLDLVILAEYKGKIERLCNLPYVPIVNSGCEYIHALIKDKYKVSVLREAHRFNIVKISTPYSELLIAMIHNISKLNNVSEHSQITELAKFHYEINKQEDVYNCQNSIAIGDFNVNPFEIACISASAMHAIPYLEEVQKPSRIVQQEIYRKFYNPMWKFLGNRAPPYATYYYNKSGDVVNYYWNGFDQVMVRPGLINAFDENALEIIIETKSKGHQLLKNGKPNKADYSDHLPLFCVLKEELI